MPTGQLMDPLVVVTGYYKKTPVRPGVGTGSHIGNGWVLTAAHVRRDLKDPNVWLPDPLTEIEASAGGSGRRVRKGPSGDRGRSGRETNDRPQHLGRNQAGGQSKPST